jgi:hypothetical protein
LPGHFGVLVFFLELILLFLKETKERCGMLKMDLSEVIKWFEPRRG